MTDTWNETSRALPAGLTCGHCASWTFCAGKFDRKPEDATCCWDPGRFRVKVELYQGAVAGLAAYRETLGTAKQLIRGWHDLANNFRMGADLDRLWGHWERATPEMQPINALLASSDPGQVTAGKVGGTDG